MEKKPSIVIKSTFVIILITLVVKILGFLEKILLAYYFGTSFYVDAYMVAFGIMFALFLLVRELIEPSFLPIFMKAKNMGDDGRKLFSTVAVILFIFLTILLVLGLFYTSTIVTIFAPGFSGEKFELTVTITKFALPAGLFISLSALTYITLNSLKSFAVPAFGDVVFKGFAILTLVILYNTVGIMGLAWGLLIGAIGRFGIHFIYIRHLFSLSLDFRSKHLKQVGILMVPLFLGVLFSQASSLVDNIFATYLKEGSIASLSYAKKIVEMPVILLPYALGIVAFPFFSELVINKEFEKLSNFLTTALKWISFIFLPLSILTILFASPIVRLLFERGAFSTQSVMQTTGPLICFAFGMWAFAIETILVQFYFACKDTKTPIVIGICCVLLNMLLTYILIQRLNHSGIALALAISKTVKVIILFGLINKKVNIDLKGIFTFLVKNIMAVAFMGIGVWLFMDNLSFVNISNKFTLIWYIAKGSILGLTFFLIAGNLFKIEEAHPVKIFGHIKEIFNL